MSNDFGSKSLPAKPAPPFRTARPRFGKIRTAVVTAASVAASYTKWPRIIQGSLGNQGPQHWSTSISSTNS